MSPRPYRVKVAPSAKINAWRSTEALLFVERYVSINCQLFLLNIMAEAW
jgi:hypothetical protein